MVQACEQVTLLPVTLLTTAATVPVKDWPVVLEKLRTVPALTGEAEQPDEDQPPHPNEATTAGPTAVQLRSAVVMVLSQMVTEAMAGGG
jgi:hypothetical protein